MVVLGGGAVSYERGSLVSGALMSLFLTSVLNRGGPVPIRFSHADQKRGSCARTTEPSKGAFRFRLETLIPLIVNKIQVNPPRELRQPCELENVKGRCQSKIRPGADAKCTQGRFSSSIDTASPQHTSHLQGSTHVSVHQSCFQVRGGAQLAAVCRTPSQISR